MGKEWLYWIGGGGHKSSKRGRFSSSSEENDETPPPPSGCMCAVLQIFDLNNHFHQFPLNHHGAFLQDEPPPTDLKGVEAPRNSLELDQELSYEAAPLSSTRKDYTSLNFPVGIQIRTSCDNKLSPRESTSECSSSSPAGTRTPGVVARLMGLDLLPEGGSPSLSSSRHSTSSPSLKDRSRHLLNHHHQQSNKPCSSLPVTPRMSSARRSDVDHHHRRLSLQINKENGDQEFDLADYIAKKVAKRRETKQDQDENRSPASHYAKQILKQVKESVGRRVGVDITNTVKNRDLQAKNKHENVVLLKPKKSSKQSTPSGSPRLRFLDTNKTKSSNSPKLSSPSSLLSSSSSPLPSADKPKPNPPKPKPKHIVELPQQQKHEEKVIQKCENVTKERYDLRIKKPPQACDAVRNKKEEAFIRSPSKSKGNYNVTEKMSKRSIPLSNELLKKNVSTLLAVKKDSSSPTKLIHKQVSDALTKSNTQLSSCASQSYNQETPTATFPESRSNGPPATTSGSGNIATTRHHQNHHQHQYIQMILNRTGINKTTPISISKWYSPSHPLDPAIFHYLELFHHKNTVFTSRDSKLNQRSNRKLIFQLVDELLADILKPYINFKPCSIITPFSRDYHHSMSGSELIDTLCLRIQDFPSANCEVLDDIDELIEEDLKKKKSSNVFEEEGENIVIEIERDIVDSLVHEMALEVFVMARPYSSKRHV